MADSALKKSKSNKSSKEGSSNRSSKLATSERVKTMDEFVADRDEQEKRREQALSAARDAKGEEGPIRAFLRRQKMRVFYNDWSFRRVVHTVLGISAPKGLRPKKSWKAADELPREAKALAEEVIEQPSQEVKLVSKLSMRMKSMRQMSLRVIDTDDSAQDGDGHSEKRVVATTFVATASIPEGDDKENDENNDDDEELQNLAATVIQSLARIIIARVRNREQWEYAVEDGTEFWEGYSKFDKKFAYVRVRRAGIYVKNFFAKRYVSDILNTATLYVIQVTAITLIQKVWRGFFIRSVVSLHRFPPKAKTVPRKRRFLHSDTLYRRVWARRHFEPEKGWPVKMGYLEYDLNAHIDAPPDGHKYGPHTYKVILAPRCEEEKSILENDPNSWVGLPIMVRTTSAHREAVDPHRKSNLRRALRLKSQPLSQPVVDLGPAPRPPRLKGDAALHQLGWVKPRRISRAEKVAAEKFKLSQENSKSGNRKNDIKIAHVSASAPLSRRVNHSKLPPPVYKLHIDDFTESSGNPLSNPSSLKELPSVYSEDYKERFAEYDRKIMAEKILRAAWGQGGNNLPDRQTHIFDTSYLRALEKEIEEVEKSRFGFKAVENQRIRYITPLRGYKYLSSQHKKAFDYSRTFGAFAEPEKHTYDTYLDKFGVNMGNKSISDLFFKKFANELRSNYGALGDTNITKFKEEREKRLNSLNPIKSTVNSNVEFDNVTPQEYGSELDSASWRTSSWAGVKSGAEELLRKDQSIIGRFDFGDEGLNSRSLYKVRPKILGKVRIWAVKPKKHYKLRYTWLPQPLVAKAAQMSQNDIFASSESGNSVAAVSSIISPLKNQPSVTAISTSNQEDKGTSIIMNDNNEESGIVAVASSGEDMRSFDVFLQEQKYRTIVQEPPHEMTVQEKIQQKLFPSGGGDAEGGLSISNSSANAESSRDEETNAERNDEEEDNEEKNLSNIKRHMGSIVLMSEDRQKKKIKRNKKEALKKGSRGK